MPWNEDSVYHDGSDGFAVEPVVTVPLVSGAHEMRISLLRKHGRTYVGMREYRKLPGGDWYMSKSGVSFAVVSLPPLIRGLLKAHEMTKGGK